MSEQVALYITNTMRIFAISLVGIFLPIYVYRLSSNYLFFSSDVFINGIYWVITYYLLRSVACILSLVFFTNIIFKILGFGKSIICSLFILIAEVILWILCENNLFFIIPAGLLAGIIVVTYWIPFHLFFMEKLRDANSHYGKATATRSFLSSSASALAPAIGGIIISFMGFRTLFLISIFMLVLAGLPTLLIVHDWKHHEHYPLKVLKEALKNSKFRFMNLAYLGEGLDFGIYAVFWPIVLYLFLQGFTQIGFLNTTSLILASIMTIVVGRVSDRYGTKIVHLIGVIVNAILYIPKIFINSPRLIYTADIMDNLNAPLVSIPYISATYEKAQNFEHSDFMIYRELVLHSGIICALLISFTLLPVLENWRILFLVASVGTLLSYLINIDRS